VARPALHVLAAGAAVALCALAPAAHAQSITQGAWRIGADALWSRGDTGAGQTVAILDLGFAGLDQSIAAGELPPREAMRLMSFDHLSGLDGRSALGDETQHGVRMAEIMHDIAPGALLVLVNYHTEVEFREAVAWIVANGIPIVSHSNSFLTPPYDGSGANAQAVDRAAAAGVLWVNSAGNYAERHWAGRADAGDVPLPLAPTAGTPLSFTLAWRGAGAHATLRVQRQAADGTWVTQATSTPDPDDPAAPGAVTPTVVADAVPWRLVVRQDTGAPADLEVFSRTVGFGPLAVPAGSVPEPGDAAGAIAVGAVPWLGDTLAGYSSQGPTDDGRLKPDIVAPTYITSNPAFPGTAGTSAATPHVAAAAVLLRQERQALGLPVDPASLRTALLGSAFDLGAPGPDLLFGAGMVRLDTSAPRVRLLVGPGRRPLVRVRVSDDGAVGAVRATLGGRQVATGTGPRARFRLPTLGKRRKKLVVSVQDASGNVGGASRWVAAAAS
jgi:subtilase family protein